MTFSYASPPVSSTDLVRLRIGDTDSTAAMFTDEEIAYALTLDASLDGAAGILMRWSIPRTAKMVDLKIGDASVSAGQRLDFAIKAMAAVDESAANVQGVAPYIGGTSIADKQTQEGDTDRVDPIFTRVLGDDQGSGYGSTLTETDDE